MANTQTDTPAVLPGELRSWLADELPRLIEAHGVPGAAAGVLVGGEIVDVAAGVLNLSTRVEADTDSLFQIGSITKVWTATLVTQLVDEGLLDLDAPVREYLPDFRVADESAAAAITTRQLLSHRAGFEGDLFTDTGRGDDCVEKFVSGLAGMPQLFEPGGQFSYNNAGYVLLGRLVEVLRGKPYDQALTEHLIQPLGLTHTAPGPYEAILHRVAQGHIATGEDGALVAAPVWALARSNAPAGSSLAMRAADLLAFARMHVEGGAAADGGRVLSRESVAAMQEPAVEVPYIGLLGEAWGLGWEIDETPVGRMVSHDGSTIGQNAFLRVIPELGVAVTLLTNGGDVYALSRALFDAVFDRLTGTRVLAPAPDPADAGPDPDAETAARFVGTYSASVMDVVVTQDDDGALWLQPSIKGELAALAPAQPAERVAPYGEHGLIQVEGTGGVHVVYAFLDPGDDGRYRFIHTSRALPRSA
ncbi:serine hydrolase domain-containing protein [Microbacterium album]|uniref:Serine hydrolase n=1 Tax=Microbacterium album TaxID=2053191 RepID=A0A917IEL1_9MICO|nr:serine hydrolase domain-containing protein [Microbacterium album]GGH45192.1 serine hydrolase [Microbacterium album]